MFLLKIRDYFKQHITQYCDSRSTQKYEKDVIIPINLSRLKSRLLNSVLPHLYDFSVQGIH